MLTRVQGKHIPLKVKGKAGRCREPWMTRDIEALVKKKKEAHDMHRQLGSSESLEEYSGCRSRVKREIRRAERGHKIVLADKEKENPKSFYKYIKGKRVTRQRVGPLKDQQGHLYADPQEMDEILNEYFSSVFIVKKAWMLGNLGK